MKKRQGDGTLLRKGLIGEMRAEISILEYVFWWILRVNMIATTAYAFLHRPDKAFEMSVSIVFMFVISIARFLFPRNWPGKISFHWQTVAIVFLTLTSYCGAFLNFYYTFPWWDMVVHTMGGVLAVVLGYQLLVVVKEPDVGELSPVVGAFSGFGFSFFTEVLWEILEFTHDSIGGGDSQHWMPNPVSPRYELFTVVPERYALLDTMTDMMCCLIGALIGGTVLWYILKKAKSERKAAELEVSKV